MRGPIITTLNDLYFPIAVYVVIVSIAASMIIANTRFADQFIRSLVMLKCASYLLVGVFVMIADPERSTLDTYYAQAKYGFLFAVPFSIGIGMTFQQPLPEHNDPHAGQDTSGEPRSRSRKRPMGGRYYA